MRINPLFVNSNNYHRLSNKNNINSFLSNPYNLSPPSNDIVSFKAVITQDDDIEKNTDKKANDVVENLFSREDYKNLTQDEIKFLISYIKKEEEIKEKYQTKIDDIKDEFLDNFFDGSEKKRAALRNDMQKELQGARTMQILFEERENESLNFRDEFIKLAQHLNYSKEVISALNADVEATKKRININMRRESFDKDFGLKKIAGYEHEKAILRANFIDKVDDEKAGKVLSKPITNAILFYGPTGCGKTTFAKALAQEADCNFEEIKVIGRKQGDKEDAFMEDMEKKLEKAQSNFLETNKRTIVLIDEFDRFFSNDNYSKSFLQYMKEVMNDCSKENHVTFFINTNDPLKIPEPLRNAHRTGIIVTLDPPNKKNMLSVLEYYFRDNNQNDIDYDKIIKKLTKTYPNEVYSNSHIKKIADIATTTAEQCGDSFNTDYMIEAIDDFNSRNDNLDLIRITKKYLDKYESEKNKIGTRYAE